MKRTFPINFLDSMEVSTLMQAELCDLIEDYLGEMEKRDVTYLPGTYPKELPIGMQHFLSILSCIQANVSGIYQKILGIPETSMLYYSMADKLIELANLEKE